MLYFKAPGNCLRRDFIAAEWGEFIRYVEVGEDQYAVRQVEVFANGNVLRYERAHWCDDFGQLLGLRFSRKPKWAAYFPEVEVIEPAEFERVWRAAQRSALWEEQVARSRAAQWVRNHHGSARDKPSFLFAMRCFLRRMQTTPGARSRFRSQTTWPCSAVSEV